jgi:tRNA(Ile)-lysidine synthase
MRAKGGTNAMLIARVRDHIREEGLLRPGEHALIAVSGGPDSMALLHLLSRLASELQIRLTVAHANHGFRGEESDEEEQLVEAYASELGLSCRAAHLDMPAYIRATGQTGQAASREQRYRFLTQAAAECGASKIALAHHADDQAETVLLRVLRGTGPQGLSGMLARRTFANVELIRPLLRINKESLVGYCREEGIPFHTDSSNAKTQYTRNRLRLQTMPLLRTYNPRLEEALTRLADVMQAENDYLTEAVQETFALLVRPENGGFSFSRKAFQGLHLALQRRLIKLLLEYLATGAEQQDDFGFMLTETVRLAVIHEGRPNSTLDLAENLKLYREYDRIRLVPPETSEPFLHYILEETVASAASAPYEQVLPNGAGRLFIETSDGCGALSRAGSSSRDVAVFDRDALVFPLVVRSRREGDRIRPMGLKGSKKVKDIFIDEKLPSRLRAVWPIVADGEERVLWLPGIRQSSHAAVTENTVRCLGMTFIGP